MAVLGSRHHGRDSPIWTWANVALRGLLEVGVIAAFAGWGFQVTHGFWSILMAIAAPVLGFGIWGLVDFRNAGRWAESLRCMEEIIISGLAALGLLSIGAAPTAEVLFGLSVLYHISVYASGARLLDGS